MAEVEAKFVLSEAQVSVLHKLLGDPHAVINQSDIYFDTPKGISLRIRQEHNLALDSHTACLTVKTVTDHHEGIRAVEELEPVIEPEDVPTWTRLFETFFKCPTDVTVSKRRWEYEIARPDATPAKFVIDQVEQLGFFCELEILSPEPEAARTELQTMIVELGLDQLTPAVGSYRYMLNQLWV